MSQVVNFHANFYGAFANAFSNACPGLNNPGLTRKPHNGHNVTIHGIVNMVGLNPWPLLRQSQTKLAELIFPHRRNLF